MTCTACGSPIQPGDEFCPYCGSKVLGLANVVAAGTPSLSCPGCGAYNLANSRFCSACGRQLPNGFGYAAEAAAAAQNTAPTSSAGRWPDGGVSMRFWTSEERVAHWARRREELAEAAAERSTAGGEIERLARADAVFGRADSDLDALLRERQEAVGADPAWLADMEIRIDIASARRREAQRRRGELWDAENSLGRRTGTPW